MIEWQDPSPDEARRMGQVMSPSELDAYIARRSSPLYRFAIGLAFPVHIEAAREAWSKMTRGMGRLRVIKPTREWLMEDDEVEPGGWIVTGYNSDGPTVAVQVSALGHSAHVWLRPFALETPNAWPGLRWAAEQIGAAWLALGEREEASE